MSNSPEEPLRLWPGVLAVALLWLTRFGVKEVVAGFDGFAYGMMGSFAFAIGVVIWWLFFSRAPWVDRLIGLALMPAALGLTLLLNHESMGLFWLLAYGLPVACLAFVAAVAAGGRLPTVGRRATMAATIGLACFAWTLVRTEGVVGDMYLVFGWRWTASPEERLLTTAPALAPPPAVASGSAAVAPALREPHPLDATALATATVPVAAPAASATNEESPAVVSDSKGERVGDWPGFRGRARDGIVRGVRIDTNWSTSPPVELWRRPVGPGWSSFAVSGGRLYTQEQRGNEEMVACYDASTGEPVWMHRDATRFFEAMGGAGPRATPTVNNGRVFAFGATGVVNALDARTGAVVWSRNASSDTGVAIPAWGFASSPLATGDVVIVAVASQLIAYDAATGAPRWHGLPGGEGYSSPQLATIDGIPQVVLLTSRGALSVSPADGTTLWQSPSPGFPIVQPSLTADGSLVMSASTANGGTGTRRVAVARGDGGWTVKELWTSNGLKPFFNDFVLHKGHAFGFDGNILGCISLEDGTRKWKGGRYGNGQLVLLPDQDLLLVISEDGDLALINATTDQFKEIAHFPALSGKTWNHPVLVGDLLLVRNGEEMAAFRLSLAGSRP